MKAGAGLDLPLKTLTDAFAAIAAAWQLIIR